MLFVRSSMLPSAVLLMATISIATISIATCLAITGCQRTTAAPAEDQQTNADGSPNDKPKHTNRLAKETSPYLLMHAHNPVDWYGWGEEAFAKAKRENKVIFLSIGYSSCYWCHVMERESFMDKEIAQFMNKHFVCIKVDREERPDVDDIYMTSIQLMRDQGGWPLSAFLTPDARPFTGGTYFPARTGDRGRTIGFLDVIRNVQRFWEADEEKLKQRADQIVVALRSVLRDRIEEDTALEIELCKRVESGMADQFDPEHGGFGSSRTKFPSPPDLMFLIDRVRRDKQNVKARQMLELTLDEMAQGGIRDHLGGGFHRYSTDPKWLIPHFEKMLYDNGQLASVYAEAYEVLGHEHYRRVVVELLDFVLREMTGESGGFYSAIDAETDAEEGKFYRWTKNELDLTIGTSNKATRFRQAYGLDGKPNFEHEYYVLYLPRSLKNLADEHGFSESALATRLTPLREKLLAVRNQRARPLTDTKVLTAWNGLMIRGFADAGRILDEQRYTDAAAKAADLILKELRTKDGRLLRTYRNGTAKLNAYLDDYAFLVDGLIALHRATEDDRWLEAAQQLTEKQIELFWDEQSGGFFYTSGDHEALIARAVKKTDSVLPSGNAVAAANLVYLAGALDNESIRDAFRRRSQETLKAFAPGLANDRQGRHMPAMAKALAAFLDGEQP